MTNSVDPTTLPDGLFLLLDWEWSNTAQHGRDLLERIATRINTRLPLRFGFADTDHNLAEWLTKECHRTGLSLHGGGYGTLLEIHNGETVAWIEHVHTTPPAQLEAFISSSSSVDSRYSLQNANVHGDPRRLTSS